jgi:ATP-dependent DNA helicase RecG
MNLKELQEQKEGPCFERKSIMMDPKALAVPLVAFANADGGTVAVGINDAGEIEGIDGHERQVNELLRVPFDFCKPTVKVDFEYMPCKDRKGRPNRVLVLNVRQSQNVHATQADEVFYRVGDKSKKLTFDERMQLLYDKGDRFYEDTPVAGATVDNLDLKLVKAYTKRIGYSKPPLTYLRENNGFLQAVHGQDKVSAAAILLFGKAPQNYFPRARVRFIRYEGTDEKTGAQMNVIKDVSFEGTILETVQKAIAFVSTQIKEHTYLAKGGLFVTDTQYPEFVRQEIIVNAVAHRDYSIKGTDIQVKMFDDRLVVESPGTLPGLVRLNTMRKVHFSRNPKIAAFLKDYGFVKEFGEGIDRMCKELEESGLPDPEYQVESFMLRCTVRDAEVMEKGESTSLTAETKTRVETRVETRVKTRVETGKQIVELVQTNPSLTREKLASTLGLTIKGVDWQIAKLKTMGILRRVGSKKGGHWIIVANLKETP